MTHSRFFYFFLKRLFDIIFSLIGLLVLSPLFLITALLIKTDSKGPVFYKQTRIGLNKKPFKIWKFRTMVQKADQMGPLITLGEDPRITRMGRSLRRSKLDELPQLINVLLGDMSLVGPRPEVSRYVDLYTDDQNQVFQYKPGITDMASIKYRNEVDLLKGQLDPETYYIQNILPDKNKINQEYMQSSNLLSDFVCIIKTIF